MVSPRWSVSAATVGNLKIRVGGSAHSRLVCKRLRSSFDVPQSVTYQRVSRGFSASLSAGHESGTPLEVDDPADLIGRPGADLVDFDRGRVRPRTVFDLTLSQMLHRGDHTETSARLSVLNLTNHVYALNFGNPFSGTHFGTPRTIRAEVRIGLH